MAKIFIVGRNPIEVSRDDAIRFNDMWIASRSPNQKSLLPEVLEAGGQTFLGRDIKGFDFSDGFVKQGIPEYDLNDEAQKAKVKSFMVEFDNWKACHPEITEWQEYHYLERQGVIKMGEHRPDDVIVESNLAKYQELKKLFASRQTLLYLRERAQTHNDPDFEADRVKKFQKMKEQMFGKCNAEKTNPVKKPVYKNVDEFVLSGEELEDLRVRREAMREEMENKEYGGKLERIAPPRNKALEKLNADAKAFDKAHGFNEEIDPAKIPF